MINKKSRVLIVDDSPHACSMMRQQLEACGIHLVWESKNGSEAWQLLNQTYYSGAPFDMVIADFNMPGFNGVELLRLMRGCPFLARTPFILATNENSKDKILEAIHAGVTSYLLKPVNKQSLFKKIHGSASKDL